MCFIFCLFTCTCEKSRKKDVISIRKITSLSGFQKITTTLLATLLIFLANITKEQHDLKICFFGIGIFPYFSFLHKRTK